MKYEVKEGLCRTRVGDLDPGDVFLERAEDCDDDYYIVIEDAPEEEDGYRCFNLYNNKIKTISYSDEILGYFPNSRIIIE